MEKAHETEVSEDGGEEPWKMVWRTLAPPAKSMT
jgi:hypothetical protein